MKALSIRQPWASFIIWGLKDVENRSWPTEYGGPFLVHAGWFYFVWGGTIPYTRVALQDYLFS